jgi:cardiolipin synthase (CMP-forming)
MTTIPNMVTVARILLVPVFVIAFDLPGTTARLVAFVIFCVAGASDALDGLAARRLKAGSDFGRMLDPIADKILVGVALMMLVAEGSIEQFNLLPGLRGLLRLVPAIIILAREILVSGLREFLAGLNVSVPVSRIAKTKTAIQMVAIGAMILEPLDYTFLSDTAALTYSTFAYSLLWIAAGLTVFTGFEYFRAGLKHVRTTPDTGAA